jgi:hypothetical protein
MADYIGATPQNPLLGLLYGGYDYLRSPQRTQQMQGLASLLESTGLPKTIERMSYGEPLTNIGRANVPLLKPETAEAMMTVAPMAGPAARGAGRLVGSQINRAMMGEGGLLAPITPQPMRMISADEVKKFKESTQSLTGNNVFDPRFDDRILEQERLKNLKTTVIPINDYEPSKVSLAQYEGFPFITTMSDRTGTGLLTDINNVVLNYPVERQGGQNFMFDNPMVWASGKTPAEDIVELAGEFKKTTGKNPLYIPQRMTPSGGDFANMTGQTMLSYAQASMGQQGKKQLDKFIKNNFISDWKGVDDQTSIDQFRALSDTKRKLMKKQMDKYFRNEGGLSIGEARLAMADKNQLTGKDAGIMNIGQIYADEPIIPISGHRAYPSGIAGRGIGVVDKDLNIFQLLQEHSKNRGLLDPRNPTRDDRRTLEMKPYGGILTEDLLKQLGY